MRKQTHKVELTSEERQTLETLVRKGEHSALKLMRAHVLLKADRNGPSWTDARISEAFGTAMHKPPTMFANGLENVLPSYLGITRNGITQGPDALIASPLSYLLVVVQV